MVAVRDREADRSGVVNVRATFELTSSSASSTIWRTSNRCGSFLGDSSNRSSARRSAAADMRSWRMQWTGRMAVSISCFPYFVPSDRLTELRRIVELWKDMGFLAHIFQMRLVVDANIILRDVRWLATKRKSPERLKGDPDVTADELQAAIDRAEAKRRELIDVRPAERESARVLTMLPKAAEFYRDQIDRGLGGDLVAAAKARTILRELLGEIMLLPGEDGSLWAEYAMQPAALLQGAGTGGRGDSICRVPAVPLDERLK